MCFLSFGFWLGSKTGCNHRLGGGWKPHHLVAHIVLAGLFFTFRMVSLAQEPGGTVVAWGSNLAGQTNVPADLTNVVKIAAGADSCLALKADGTMVGWGDNAFGQLSFPTGISKVKSIALNGGISMALFSDGTVKVWGDNSAGQLDVPANLTSALAISAGNTHCLALLSNRTVTAWGSGGLASTNVPTSLTNVIAISAGGQHSLAITGNGRVVGWGSDQFGQLDVPTELTNATAVAAGRDHSVALTGDGTVVAFGNNGSGQCSVPIGLSNVVKVAAGYAHSLALKSDGTVVAWGDLSPTPADLFNVKDISAGTSHDLGIVKGAPHISQQPNGQTAYSGGNPVFSVEVGAFGIYPVTYQWQFNGINIAGATHSLLNLTNVHAGDAGIYAVQVSDIYGSTLSTGAALGVVDSSPLVTTQPTATLTFLGGMAAFKVAATGSTPMSYQWQFNGNNLPGETGSSLMVTNVRFSESGNYSVVVGNAFGATNSAAARLDVSRVAAWGINPSNAYAGAPINQTLVPAGLTNVRTVSVGASHSLALMYDGTVVGWGDNSSGQTNVPPGLANVVAVAGGGFHSLALQQNGTVVGWGRNFQWVFDQEVPPFGLSNVIAISAGTMHSLALRSDGTVVQWGDVSHGQNTPPPLLRNVISIAAGDYYSVALKSDGTVAVWGTLSTPPGLSNVVSIAAGGGWLALKADGTVVGEGTSVPSGLSNIVAVAAGNDHNLAIRVDGTVVAWGNDGYGQGDIPPGLKQTIAVAGGAYFSVALLSDSFPEVVRQPLGVSVFSGMDTFLNAGVAGSGNLACQWRMNGTNLPGATNTTLVLNKVQPWQSGLYSLVVSNAEGQVESSKALLNVTASIPVLIAQPTVSYTPAGLNTSFAVFTTGSVPAGYQWYFNGNLIPGATAATLSLNNVQWSEEGGYAAVVSNQFGAVTSLVASLVVPRSRVVAWGDASFGETNVPPFLTDGVAISAAFGNSLALKANGTVAGWGYDGSQQTKAPANASNLVAIAAGGAILHPFTLGLTVDGTVLGWGNNSVKQCNPPAGLSNVIALAAGQGHSLALRRDGVVVAWGDNTRHQTNVPVTLSNVVAISAGVDFSLALQNNSVLSAWGNTSAGVAGFPTGLTNVVAIACGYSHCLALKGDGSVVGWGDNAYRQSSIPLGLSNVVGIAAGGYHSLAFRNDGTVVAWGQNAAKQTNVPPGLKNVSALAGGDGHSLALVQEGPPGVLLSPANQANFAGLSIRLRGVAAGQQPISQQWWFNGLSIPGATNNTLLLTNLQPPMAGSYWFTSSNALGEAVSSNAVVTVLTNPPAFILQPTNQAAFIGSNVTFSAAVGPGPSPYHLQWRFEGADLPGATSNQLALTNVLTTNQGNYSVVALNDFGSATSSNAFLTVVPLDLPNALNTPGRIWTNGANTAWFAQTKITHDGIAAAQIGTLGVGQTSTLQTTVSGPATVMFWWQQTQPTFDSFTFSSTLWNVRLSMPFSSSWVQQTVYLGPGDQTVSWDYLRRDFNGLYKGYVDQVLVVPGATLPAIDTASPGGFVRSDSNVVLSVTAHGTPPLFYQWQFNGIGLPLATNSQLTLPGVKPANSGTYSVLITNNYGSASANIPLSVEQFSINTLPPNLFLSTNGFQFRLDGVLTTNPVVIFGSTDLVNWVSIFTNSSRTGTVDFLDLNATNFPLRFYRARE